MVDTFGSKKAARDHLVELTKKLVSYPSHRNEPLKIFELVDFIKRYYDDHDMLKIDEHVINGTPSIIVSTEHTKHPHIMLSGHVDVVISSSAQFIATVDGDKLHGSGTMDMKGGIACMMAVLKFFAEKYKKDPEDCPSLGMMITSDEESGGLATCELLSKHGYFTDFCVVNEGRHAYDIVKREKGMFVVGVKLHGASIHSAYPWKGRNAVEALSNLATDLIKWFPARKDGWHPSISVTGMKGGGTINVIPGSAEMIIAARLTDDKKYTPEKILARIKKKLPDAQIEELVNGAVFHTNPRHSHMQLLKKCAEKVTKRKMKFGQNNGASDARFFGEHNIPTAVLGPVGHHSHSPHEYVEIPSLVEHFYVLKSFIEEEHKQA